MGWNRSPCGCKEWDCWVCRAWRGVCEIVIDARGGCSKSRRSLRNGRLVLIPGATDISVASSVAQKRRHNVEETSVHTYVGFRSQLNLN